MHACHETLAELSELCKGKYSGWKAFHFNGTCGRGVSGRYAWTNLPTLGTLREDTQKLHTYLMFNEPWNFKLQCEYMQKQQTRVIL